MHALLVAVAVPWALYTCPPKDARLGVAEHAAGVVAPKSVKHGQMPDVSDVVRPTVVSVEMCARIDAHGKLAEFELAEDPEVDPRLVAAASEVLRSTTWKPGTLDGRPASVWIPFKVSFGPNPRLDVLLQEREEPASRRAMDER